MTVIVYYGDGRVVRHDGVESIEKNEHAPLVMRSGAYMDRKGEYVFPTYSLADVVKLEVIL